MKFYYTIFTLFLATYSFSQNSLKNYHYGSYTTKEGEVINGYIKDLGLTAMSHSIKYKKGDASGPKWFSWNEIRSYRFKGLTFVSIGSKGCFMQQVTYGQLSLYRKFYTPGTIDAPSPETFRYYLRLKGQSMLKVKENNFRKKGSAYLSSYSELQKKILNKELRLKNIQSVVNQYNKWSSEQKG